MSKNKPQDNIVNSSHCILLSLRSMPRVIEFSCLAPPLSLSFWAVVPHESVSWACLDKQLWCSCRESNGRSSAGMACSDLMWSSKQSEEGSTAIFCCKRLKASKGLKCRTEAVSSLRRKVLFVRCWIFTRHHGLRWFFSSPVLIRRMLNRSVGLSRRFIHGHVATQKGHANIPLVFPLISL